MEIEQIRDQVAENRELEKQLTKRNEQYVFDLKKALMAANLSEIDLAKELNVILPELVNGQRTGQTARQLFGTVTERSDLIINKPKSQKESSLKEMWLDNSLLLFVFLTFMAGVIPMFSKTPANSQNQGLLTILVASISGGYAFYLIYKFVYRFDRPGADQTGRPGALKSMFIMVAILLVWITIFMFAGLIPPSINITLSNVAYIVLAAAVFLVRYLIKKKFGIRGSILTR